MKKVVFAGNGVVYDHKIEMKDNHGNITEIQFRNVGEKNKEAQIQFSIIEYLFNKRRKVYHFSIPSSHVDWFIEKLKEIKK